MPAIHTRASVAISPEKQENIKMKLGKAIELLPGKSEAWLMCSFEPECPIYFQGSDVQPSAFIEVMLYGKTDEAHSNRLTGAITEIIREELDIPPERIYIKYEEVAYWGWNGQNL